MKHIILLIPLLLLTACTSFTNSVRKTEMAAVHTGVITMQAWAQYYRASTNGASADRITELNATKSKFDSLSIKLGTSAQLVDTMLASFVTNGVGKIDVQNTLSLLASNATTITLEIKQILTK